MGELAPRLSTLEGANLVILRNKKNGSEVFADAVAAGLQSEYKAIPRIWVKPSPYSPLSNKMRKEIVGWADGAVASLGDCGHGSSVLRHDIFSLEEAGCPVAWVDTPGRLPRLTRRPSDGAWLIEYEALQYLTADARKAGGVATPTGLASAIETFEKFGLHRALRLAGAQPGDRVVVRDLEVTLWDYPPKRLEGWDGVLDYPYVEIPKLRGQSDDVLRTYAKDAVPKLASLLTA